MSDALEEASLVGRGIMQMTFSTAILLATSRQSEQHSHGADIKYHCFTDRLPAVM